MRVLVCVKRVPTTGGRIVLTADGQEIDTRYLGFTVSPHEECAVEEAVRLVERLGGSSTVLTLGPDEAEEQLRDAMAVGADRAILLRSGGQEWDAIATAAAIGEAIRASEAADGPFDIILFGNEAADTGDYQVGIRVAVALDRPCVTGAKAIEPGDGTLVARRESATGGWEAFPPRRRHGQGGHQPAALPVDPRAPPRQAQGDRGRGPGVALLGAYEGGPAASRPGAIDGRDPRRGPGGGARRRGHARADRGPRLVSGSVLALVEHADGEPERLSLEALALGARVAGALETTLEAVLVGTGGRAAAAALGRHGVSVVHLAEDPRLGDFAPGAWAACVEQAMRSLEPTAVVAPGSDRGNEVMAHVGARTGLPVAANVVDVEPGEPFRITRQRWAGSLLEDARLDASIRLMTVAPHVLAVDERATGPEPTVLPFSVDLTERDLRVRVTERVAPAAGSVSLADARVVIGGGRGVGDAASFGALEELAGLLNGAVGVSRAVTSAGWRPHAEQIGQTGQRVAPDLYIACGISGAIQHIVGCKGAKRILAINIDRESPIMEVAGYAVVGDLHTIVPAISAEILRRRKGPEAG
jgi:electron transfer flavoprotein alpha subunit